MKAGFLTQILVVPVTGITFEKAYDNARALGYKMFAFNGAVYSTNEIKALYLLADTKDSVTGHALFTLSDLVDYTYNP